MGNHTITGGQAAQGRTARRLLALFTLAAGCATGVLAYSLKPYKWPTGEVGFKVNPVNLNVSQSEAEMAVVAGASAWDAQSRATFRFAYAGRTSTTTVAADSVNAVIFRPESNSTPSILATTYWWSNNQGQLTAADIVFWDAGHQFLGSATSCSGAFYIQDVATHEFGHVLGLNHSGVAGATMQPTLGSCSQEWRSLSSDDIAGVEALYPPTPGGPPAPPTGVTLRKS